MFQVALITGVSYGLGKSISEKLLANDFKVYGVSRTDPYINDSKFSWIQADLCDSKDIQNIYLKIKETKIDVLVNNAGTAFEKLALEYNDQDFDKVFNLNFKAPIKLTQALLPKLSRGLIINVSSISDRYPDPMYGLYASTKAALNIFFETIATENKNLIVVNLLPNYIDTPLQHKVSDSHKDFDWNMPMKTNDVAEIVPYLINHKENLESGSRIIIVSKAMGERGKNPEKLWIYTIDDKQMKKVE